MPKFSSRTYRLLWDAHSMTGVVIGLALFVLFATGALLLFRGEIRKWEEPALRSSPGEKASLDALTEPVLDSLGQGDKPPSYVYMGLPAGGNDNLYLYATGGTAGGSRDVWVNPESGEWVANPNDGAITQTLYYLHFFYQIGLWGLYLSGAVGLFALLAIVTGTAVHLERLVKDFFQFRPSEKLRVAWADAHKVLGTIGLPFQVMYAFTGAYFGLVGLIALPYASMLFGGDMNTFYQKAGYYAPTVQVDSAETASPPESSLEGVAARAEDAWPGFTPQTMIISNMGAPDSRIEVIGQTQGVVFGGTGSLVYHGATGKELQRSPPGEAGPLNQVVQSMEELHFAEFGGRALEILFFLLALASSAVILTGNFIWLEVRRAQDRAVNTILARLTAGVATGMAPATALMFLSAWWHPPSMGTDEWTDLVLFGSWGLCVVYALARSNIARTHRTLLAAGGLLALLVPVANGFATGDWPWVAWAAGRWAVVGIDVGAVLSGGALLGLAAELDVGETPPAEPSKSEENLSPTAGKTPEEVLLDAG